MIDQAVCSNSLSNSSCSVPSAVGMSAVHKESRTNQSNPDTAAGDRTFQGEPYLAGGLGGKGHLPGTAFFVRASPRTTCGGLPGPLVCLQRSERTRAGETPVVRPSLPAWRVV